MGITCSETATGRDVKANEKRVLLTFWSVPAQSSPASLHLIPLSRCNNFEHGSLFKKWVLGYPVELVKGMSAVCKGSMWTQARSHIHYSRRRRILITQKGTRKTSSSMQTNALPPCYGYLCSEHARSNLHNNTRFRNNWEHFLRNCLCQALVP